MPQPPTQIPDSGWMKSALPSFPSLTLSSGSRAFWQNKEARVPGQEQPHGPRAGPGGELAARASPGRRAGWGVWALAAWASPRRAGRPRRGGPHREMTPRGVSGSRRGQEGTRVGRGLVQTAEREAGRQEGQGAGCWGPSRARRGSVRERKGQQRWKMANTGCSKDKQMKARGSGSHSWGRGLQTPRENSDDPAVVLYWARPGGFSANSCFSVGRQANRPSLDIFL